MQVSFEVTRNCIQTRCCSDWSSRRYRF